MSSNPSLMKRILTILLLAFSILPLKGQLIEANIKSLPGLWTSEGTGYYYGGGGMELLFEQPLNTGTVRAGLEFRTVNWGNQAMLNVGHTLPYSRGGRWYIRSISSMGLGLALFRDNPLFVLSLEHMPEIIRPTDKRIDFAFGIGIRYTYSPAYQNYGDISQLFEFPIKVGLRYNLGFR